MRKEFSANAPVVQRIEWWSPKPHIQVRFLAGARLWLDQGRQALGVLSLSSPFIANLS